MPLPSPAPDPSHALVLRLLSTLPAETEPRHALRLLLERMRDELGVAGLSLEVSDPLDPTRHLAVVTEGEAIAPDPPRRAPRGVVTWPLGASGAPFARLRILDPDDRLDRHDDGILRAFVTLYAQNGLRGLDLDRRALFARCADQLAIRLGAGADEADLYVRLVRSLTELLPIDRAAALTLDEDRRSLVPRAVSDRRGDLRPRDQVPGDQGVRLVEQPWLQEILNAGRIVFAEDIEEAPLPPEWKELAIAHRVRSALVVPLSDAQGAWGLIVLCRESAGPVLSAEDMELARMLLQHLAPLLQISRVARPVHVINHLITAVQVNAQLLCDGDDAPLRRTEVENILSSAARARRLTRSILGIPEESAPRHLDPSCTTQGPPAGPSQPNSGPDLRAVCATPSGAGGRVEEGSRPVEGATSRVRFPLPDETPLDRAA